MNKIWYRNPLKSEVIGSCGGDEKNVWPRKTDKSRTLKKEKRKKRHKKTKLPWRMILVWQRFV